MTNSRETIHDDDNSRPSGRLKVTGELNSRVAAESKLMDHPVPLAVQVPEMYRMVSSRSVSTRTLQLRASGVKVKEWEGSH